MLGQVSTEIPSMLDGAEQVTELILAARLGRVGRKLVDVGGDKLALGELQNQLGLSIIGTVRQRYDNTCRLAFFRNNVRDSWGLIRIGRLEGADKYLEVGCSRWVWLVAHGLCLSDCARETQIRRNVLCLGLSSSKAGFDSDQIIVFDMENAQQVRYALSHPDYRLPA